MDLTTCPRCGNAAEILTRFVLESTDGPIEHAKLKCVERHWFTLPVASLASPTLERHDPTRVDTPRWRLGFSGGPHAQLPDSA